MFFEVVGDHLAVLHVHERFLLFVSHLARDELERLADAVLHHFLLGFLQLRELSNQMIEYSLD